MTNGRWRRAKIKRRREPCYLTKQHKIRVDAEWLATAINFSVRRLLSRHTFVVDTNEEMNNAWCRIEFIEWTHSLGDSHFSSQSGLTSIRRNYTFSIYCYSNFPICEWQACVRRLRVLSAFHLKPSLLLRLVACALCQHNNIRMTIQQEVTWNVKQKNVFPEQFQYLYIMVRLGWHRAFYLPRSFMSLTHTHTHTLTIGKGPNETRDTSRCEQKSFTLTKIEVCARRDGKWIPRRRHIFDCIRNSLLVPNAHFQVQHTNTHTLRELSPMSCGILPKTLTTPTKTEIWKHQANMHTPVTSIVDRSRANGRGNIIIRRNGWRERNVLTNSHEHTHCGGRARNLICAPIPADRDAECWMGRRYEGDDNRPSSVDTVSFSLSLSLSDGLWKCVAIRVVRIQYKK